MSKASAAFSPESSRVEGSHHKSDSVERTKHTPQPSTAVAWPVPVNRSDIPKIREGTKQLFVCVQSVSNAILQDRYIPQVCGLLFNPEGVLLKIYGGEALAPWLKQRHITKWTHWDEAHIGPSIFSALMADKRPTSLLGDQNVQPDWADCAFYAAPVTMGADELKGVLVLLTPLECANPTLQAMVGAICRSVELQYLWLNMISSGTNISEGLGLISLDQSTGQNRILTMGDENFKMLGLPIEDPHYNLLEDYIDPPPANTAFWSMVNAQRKVSDHVMSLECHGKSYTVSVSASKYEEPKFHISGLVLILSSYRRMQQLASKYSGSVPHFTFESIIGKSDAYLNVVRWAQNAAISESNILLLGESGTGKDVLAQAIHNHSRRQRGPFVAVNCASFSKELIGSELFGYEEGAFTGAKRGGSMGKFELANHGTLFLDEIGDMPLDLQAVLLRALEERSFRKVGGNQIVKVDVRILAATNTRLQDRVKNGLFREDLFYRLGVVRLQVPPLREREMDVILLAEYFIQLICTRQGRALCHLEEDAKRFFLSYRWPGNVRELQNLLEGIISTHGEEAITVDMVERYLGYDAEPGTFGTYLPTLPTAPTSTEEEMRIRESLRENRNNKTKAAASLGIPRRTFYRRLRDFGIE